MVVVMRISIHRRLLMIVGESPGRKLPPLHQHVCVCMGWKPGEDEAGGLTYLDRERGRLGGEELGEAGEGRAVRACA